MKVFHQGGCMLAMHTSNPMFPSRTDHIMSRYRPIAPKPVLKPEGTEQTDSHSLSSLSADKSTTKSTEYRGKRTRKRAQDSKSPRPAKRNRHTGIGSTVGKNGAVEGNVESQTVGFNLTPILSNIVATEFGPGGLQRFKESYDNTQNSVSVSLSLAAKSPPRETYFGQVGQTNHNSAVMCTRDGLSFNVWSSNHEVLEKDAGFMERAAASTPALFPAEASNTHVVRKELSFTGPSFSTSFGADSEVCSGEDAPESRKSNLVTLSLLPDTPSHVSARSTSSRSTLSLFSSDMGLPCDKQATASSTLNTNLTMSSKGRWPEADIVLRECAPDSLGPVAANGFDESLVGTSQGDCGGRVIDTSYLEQHHGASSESVMLTDASNRVLWANTAYKRASFERMNGRMQSIGPHIDPLGIRTQLAGLTFQPPFPAPKCRVVLWGFLKKFVFAAGHSNMADGQARVIAPQPVRVVGSTINLQNILYSDPHTAPLNESLDSVQERLEKGNVPSVITDLRHRVRWVNSAYKQMVGQPKCAWLASTVGRDVDKESLAQLRLAGEVSLVCDEAQPPDEVAGFTCRVLIQWSHQGEHYATSVTSGVVRLDDGTAGSMYVWGFDMSDAGVKNLLKIEDTSPFC